MRKRRATRYRNGRKGILEYAAEKCHAEICEANYAKDSNLCIDCQIENEYNARMSWKRQTMNYGQLISESEFSKVYCRIDDKDSKPQWIFYDKHCRTYQTISEAKAMRVLDCHAVQKVE